MFEYMDVWLWDDDDETIGGQLSELAKTGWRVVLMLGTCKTGDTFQYGFLLEKKVAELPPNTGPR